MFYGIEKYKDENSKLFKSVNDMKFYTSGHLRIYIDSTIDYLNSFTVK